MAAARERSRVRWLDLLRVLRRMEARGEIRGGWFVDGAGGEHFALPAALPLLREVRTAGPSGEIALVAAADPIPPQLVPGGAERADTLILCDGAPVARQRDGRISPVPGNALPPESAIRAAQAILPRPVAMWR
jgi:ATP-dependent Lhr-like helicase